MSNLPSGYQDQKDELKNITPKRLKQTLVDYSTDIMNDSAQVIAHAESIAKFNKDTSEFLYDAVGKVNDADRLLNTISNTYESIKQNPFNLLKSNSAIKGIIDQAKNLLGVKEDSVFRDEDKLIQYKITGGGGVIDELIPAPFQRRVDAREMSIDLRSLWDITIKPYVGDENNKNSYLPEIPSPYKVNEDRTWLPATSFNLGDYVMHSKELPTPEGTDAIEINGIKSRSNEFDFEIVEDQYGTWTKYLKEVTSIMSDMDGFYVAPYKHVTFQITVYLLTPSVVAGGTVLLPETGDLVTDTMKTKLKKAAANAVELGKELAKTKVSDLLGYTEGVKREVLSNERIAEVRYRRELLCILKDYKQTHEGQDGNNVNTIRLDWSIVGEIPPKPIVVASGISDGVIAK